MDERKKETDDKKYERIIQDFLPLEKDSTFLEGSEGKAFFVGDDYVIKKFSKLDRMDIEGLYGYYDEILQFRKMGINLPQFYQYFISPQNDFYILQERIKGQPLRIDYLDENYPMFIDLCSRQQFDSVIKDPSKDIPLFTEIVMIYANKFLQVSKMLEGVSEQNLEKFIVDIINMFTIGQFGRPDPDSTNVFLTDKGLYNIDNFVTRYWNFNEYNQTPEKEKQTLAFLSLFNMLNENGILNELFKEYKILAESNQLSQDLRKIVDQNVAVCRQTALRLAKITKRVLKDPNIIDKDVIQKLYLMLKETFPDDANTMIHDIEGVFEK